MARHECPEPRPSLKSVLDRLDASIAWMMDGTHSTVGCVGTGDMMVLRDALVGVRDMPDLTDDTIAAWVAELGVLGAVRRVEDFTRTVLVCQPVDEFKGDDEHLVRSIEALLGMDADGVLVPHGLGGHARALLSAAAARLVKPAQAPAERASTGEVPIAPDVCPITGRRFWGNMPHPDRGMVALYGGPYDSYTIPHRDGDEIRCERYDQDAGHWVEGGEPVLQIEDESTSTEPVAQITGVARRKVASLVAEGYRIVGYTLEAEGKRSAVMFDAAVRWLTEQQRSSLMFSDAALVPEVSTDAARMSDALTRLRRWSGWGQRGDAGYAYSWSIAHGVWHWFDGGMQGDLPPLPDWAKERS